MKSLMRGKNGYTASSLALWQLCFFNSFSASVFVDKPNNRHHPKLSQDVNCHSLWPQQLDRTCTLKKKTNNTHDRRLQRRQAAVQPSGSALH